MKNWHLLFLLGIFLVGCEAVLPTPQIIQVTRQVRVIKQVDVTRQVEVTRIVTATPPPVPARMFLPADCLTRQPDLDYSRYDSLYIDTIGGCSFLAPSPDGQTLAYSALTCLEGTGICGEAVKVLKLGEENPTIIAFSSEEENMWIAYLGWSSTDKLVFSWDTVAGGVGTYIIGPDFVQNRTSRPATAQLVPTQLYQWNKSKTAFVTFAAGMGACYSHFSGYDFTSGKVFPDIPAILNLNDTYVRITPVDAALKDWWDGDAEVDLLITPMEYDYARQDYKFLPTFVGKITLTSSGPVYTTLAGSNTESYYFTGDRGHRSVESKPYEVHYCLGG